MSRANVNLYYFVIIAIGTWPLAFAWMAFWSSRQKVWMLTALNQTAVMVFLYALVIQRTMPAAPGVSAPLGSWLLGTQRVFLGLACLSALWLVSFMLAAANGRMGNVRRAFCAPWIMVVKAWRALTRRRVRDGAEAV